MTTQGSTSAVRIERRGATVGGGHLLLGVAAASLLGVVLLLGFVFAGSSAKLPDGVRVAGVDVGGLTTREARIRLSRRAERLQDVPVMLVAGSQRWQVTPAALGVKSDWSRAVQAAAAEGDGLGPIRGYRRLALKLSPVDVEPSVSAYSSAVEYQLDLLAADVERPRREPRLVRHGLSFEAVPGETGQFLDRAEARRILLTALASFSRRPVELPVRVDPPRVTPARIRALQARAARVVSAPVKLRVGDGVRTVSPTRLARMLQLPSEGVGRISIGGQAGNAYFESLDRVVSRPAINAAFVVDGNGKIAIVPSSKGVTLDVPRTASALLAAAERRTTRVARAVVVPVKPERTTAAAHAMGISGVVGSYETQYGGIPNRIHNVQLVARLIDGTLIAPGTTFSFNETTGARTADKGFLEAPVIINGELQTGLGGGVCQVSTTVFNAAYEAGLPISSRTNHALYISHYPLGRDATVDYPGIDLKFVNDTGRWLLLRTFVGPSSLVVNLYGTPQDRRVVTETAPLRVVSGPPVKKRIDASLAPGEVVVESYGVPAQSTSVHRRVYSAAGKLLSDSTWYSSYTAEPKIVAVGPKPVKKKPAKKKKGDAESATPAEPEPVTPPVAPKPLS